MSSPSTRTVPLGPEDIILGKTVVRKIGKGTEVLVTGRDEYGIGTPTRVGWDTLRKDYEISFDHGVTFGKPEKEAEQ